MNKVRKGFTLAEVLLTLTVIGIVAAISIPALMADIDDQKWTGPRERAVYNIREASKSLSINNGGIENMTSTIAFRDALAKYMAVSKVCDVATNCFHIDSATLKGIDGNVLPSGVLPTAALISSQTAYTDAGTAVGMVLNNGTIMNIVYNKKCSETPTTQVMTNHYGQNHVCANIIFDTNGYAKPNQVGKDIGFATVINPTNTVVAGIMPYKGDVDVNGQIAASGYMNWYSAQKACASIEPQGTYHLPTKEELNSLYYNKAIIGNIINYSYRSFSESVTNRNYAWNQNMNTGTENYDAFDKNYDNGLVRCVRR